MLSCAGAAWNSSSQFLGGSTVETQHPPEEIVGCRPPQMLVLLMTYQPALGIDEVRVSRMIVQHREWHAVGNCLGELHDDVPLVPVITDIIEPTRGSEPWRPAQQLGCWPDRVHRQVRQLPRAVTDDDVVTLHGDHK